MSLSYYNISLVVFDLMLLGASNSGHFSLDVKFLYFQFILQRRNLDFDSQFGNGIHAALMKNLISNGIQSFIISNIWSSQ